MKEMYRARELDAFANRLMDRLDRAFNLPQDEGSRISRGVAVRRSAQRMQKYGFNQDLQLERLATWEIFFGANFEERDPEGRLMDICTDSYARSSDRFAAFSERLTELTE